MSIQLYHPPQQAFSPNARKARHRRYFVYIGNLFLSVGNLLEVRDMFCKWQQRLKADGLGLSGDAAMCLYKLAVVALREYYASKLDASLDMAM